MQTSPAKSPMQAQGERLFDAIELAIKEHQAATREQVGDHLTKITDAAIALMAEVSAFEREAGVKPGTEVQVDGQRR